MNLRIVFIKVSYKFLLHEYSLGKYKVFLNDFKKFENFLLKYESMIKFDYIKRMMNTLMELDKNGKLDNFDSRYVNIGLRSSTKELW